MSIEPGEMQTRVVYQTQASEVDAVGQPLKTWSDVFTCWAAVRPLSAKELYYGQSTRSETTHRIAIRWRPGVSPKGRFVLANNRDRVFKIFSVVNTDEAREELVILAAEAS